MLVQSSTSRNRRRGTLNSGNVKNKNYKKESAMAGISIRFKNGRYEARKRIDGVDYSAYGKTEKEAEKKIMNKIQNSKNKIQTKNTLVEVAIEEFLELSKSSMKSSSYNTKRGTFKRYIKGTAIGKTRVSNLREREIQNHIDTLAKCGRTRKTAADDSHIGLSLNTVKKVYGLLNEYYSYAVSKREIEVNPMIFVKMPRWDVYNVKESTCKDSFFNGEELKRIIQASEIPFINGTKSYRYGEVYILLSQTGLRSGEVRALKLENIDLEEKNLYVKHSIEDLDENGKLVTKLSDPKSKASYRTIPLNDRAILSIQRLMQTTADANTGFLITSQSGRILSHAELENGFERILYDLKLEASGLHSLRRTFATYLVNTSGCGNIKDVSELLGHSDIAVTLKYYIKSDEINKRNLVDSIYCD